MNSRIKQFLNAEQISPAKLASKLDVQRSNISHILSGRNKPGFDFIKKLLLRYPLLNPDWLILGKGEMYHDDRKSQDLFNQKNTTTNNNQQQNKPVSNQSSEEAKTTINQPENKAIIPINSSSSKVIERVLVFYTDKTFDSYTPS